MLKQYEQSKYPAKKTLITCHHNADFDALTSLIGISLFFPNAQIVFPGSQERLVQDFFEEIVTPLFNIILPKEVDYEGIERLVIVDTQSYERIAHIKPLLLKHNLVTDDENLQTIENNDKIEILIWDHHPGGDIIRDGGQCELVGSASTLIIEEIKKVFGKIPCEFAHILALGVYVDTGSFSYISTTSRDYLACAWLLEQGFSPDFIGSYTQRTLNKDQISVLNNLNNSSQLIDVAGIRIVIAFTRLDYYLSDFATLIPHVMELNSCHVLFALASMNNSVQVVARSKDNLIDVGKICRLLGGGGHTYAAAAMVKDMTLHEVILFLQNQISLLAHLDKTARRLMTSPAIVAYEHDTMLHAEEIMSHYGLKAIPICKTNSKICIGWLEHQLAIKAINHNLGQARVDHYMHRRFKVINQNANLQMLMDIIVGERQRLIPVVDTSVLIEQNENYQISSLTHDFKENKLLELCPIIGVVTRTDLIRIFLDDSHAKLPSPRQNKLRKKNIARQLNNYIPAPCLRLLELAGKLASACNVNIYVVGGFVRDLLMENRKMPWPNMDIDLVVEGNALVFARGLAKILNGRVREHGEFLTALLIFNSKFLEEDFISNLEAPECNLQIKEEIKNIDVQRPNHKSLGKNFSEYNYGEEKKQSIIQNNTNFFEIRIDIATARLEYYESPAALPIVELSSIRMDLTRRDFSINAMAIQLNKENFGELVDFFDGQVDIKQKRIRMLHALSFVEDPTRTLRAIRFEQRYDFKLGGQCERLIKHSVEQGLIAKLSGKRVVTELVLILKEKDPLKYILRLQYFNLLSAIHPILEVNSKEKKEFLEEFYKVIVWYKLLYLDEKLDHLTIFILAVCRNANQKDILELFERFDLYEQKTNEILQLRSKIIYCIPKLENWYDQSKIMSELHNILYDMDIEGLLFLITRAHFFGTEDFKKQLSQYVYKTRLEVISVTGKDILSLGIPKGPLVGKILKEILEAKMNEEINGFDEEMDYAEQRAIFYLS